MNVVFTYHWSGIRRSRRVSCPDSLFWIDFEHRYVQRGGELRTHKNERVQHQHRRQSRVENQHRVLQAVVLLATVHTEIGDDSKHPYALQHPTRSYTANARPLHNDTYIALHNAHFALHQMSHHDVHHHLRKHRAVHYDLHQATTTTIKYTIVSTQRQQPTPTYQQNGMRLKPQLTAEAVNVHARKVHQKWQQIQQRRHH